MRGKMDLLLIAALLAAIIFILHRPPCLPIRVPVEYASDDDFDAAYLEVMRDVDDFFDNREGDS